VCKLCQKLNDCVLEVGAMAVSAEVNGPGHRLAIWLQGCPFNCKGCFNPEFRPMKRGKKINAASVLQTAAEHGVEGLTFTGGEPFMQAKALGLLAGAAREQGLGIVCYSGFYLDELKKGEVPGSPGLLKNTDLLIDGPFKEDLQGPFCWRGSSNQGIHCLSSRYMREAEAAMDSHTRAAEVVVGSGEMFITGIFPMEFWNRLEARLKNRVPQETGEQR